MTLRILTSAGVSPNSGVPIYRVQCSECGEVYRRVGFPWDIKRHGRCATCAGSARRVPDRVAGVNARRAARDANNRDHVNRLRRESRARAKAAEMRKCR